MTYLISYFAGGEYGNLCYQGAMTDDGLKKLLCVKDVSVLSISEFNDNKQNLVSFVADGKFKHMIAGEISDCEDFNKLWLELNSDHESAHILAFIPLKGQYK